jgi:hypothetical protein
MTSTGSTAGAGDPPPSSESVVAGAENFESGGGEAAETPGCFGAARRKNEGRLRLIEFARDAIHGAVVERLAIGYDGEGVAGERSAGEDIDKVKRDFLYSTTHTPRSLVVIRRSAMCLTQIANS